MTEPLILGLFSKGRLKDQAEAWLADCGLTLQVDGGERGYSAGIKELPQVKVLLLSAADIAAGLDAGDLHLGLCGEDLLRERGEDIDARVPSLRPLGFGRADLVVAAPESWIDVVTMDDLDEVAAAFLARTGRRMRVATKYMVQTRAFFARHGLADYRIVESGGATEGAPASGAAELIVDITTTGATLKANGLKPVGDGLILKSQAHLLASLTATWTPAQLAAARKLLSVVEARAAAVGMAIASWPPEQDAGARKATADLAGGAGAPRANGVLVREEDVIAVTAALAAAGVGPIVVVRPDFAFQTASPAADLLAARLTFARA